MASVTSTVRPAPSARHATRTATGSTWIPSQIRPANDVAGERGADRPGVAVGERRHGVEQVGHHAHAGLRRAAANSAGVQSV